jgi:predicted RNA-binding protein associated with RNAse of E/G family
VSELVTLHYHRPPDRTDVFVQELLYADDEVFVTYLAATPMKRPFVVDGRVGLDDGSPAIWFTFPGRMHDIGRFHTPAGEFTGLYANILEPVEIVSPLEWRATDLFVDVWIAPGTEAVIVDRDELEQAAEQGWITRERARRALAEAELLVESYRNGSWPPAIVNEWTLARVR